MPSRSWIATSASAIASSGIPDASANAGKEPFSGVVSTPPKSQTTARIIASACDRRRRRRRAAQDVVAPDALATLHPPVEERAVQALLAEVERRPAQHLARGAAGVVALLGHPQLEAGAALALLGVIGRRQPRVVDLVASPPSNMKALTASSRWFFAFDGRTAVSVSARSSPSHADTVRASSMRLQSGLPHSCPRWPGPRPGTCGRRG